MPDYDNFINGKFVPSSGKDRIEVMNPSTGKLVCTVPESTPSDVETAVAAAEATQHAWGRRPAIERAKVLRALAEKVRAHVNLLPESSPRNRASR
jgi:lactaldehyde dehydrogenase/glycolaldehyde dehydrogenase